MADNLEKYIRDHRTEFDTDLPGPQVWDNIKTELKDPKVRSMSKYSWVWKAAAVFLFGLSSYLLIERNYSSFQTQDDVAVGADNGGFSLGEIEMHYTSIIEQKKVEIQALTEGRPRLLKEFQQDIGALDSLYMDLQSEFTQTHNKVVIDAMINNLKLRIEILNYQLSIIEKIQNRGNDEGTQLENEEYKI